MEGLSLCSLSLYLQPSSVCKALGQNLSHIADAQLTSATIISSRRFLNHSENTSQRPLLPRGSEALEIPTICYSHNELYIRQTKGG